MGGEKTPLRAGQDVSNEEEELNNAWSSTSTFERSLSLLSSPLISPRRVDDLTRSPQPGGPSRRNRTKEQDHNYKYQQLQKIQSLDFARNVRDGKPPIISSSSNNSSSRLTEEKKPDAKQEDTKATFSQCVFNTCNCMMGIGLLALPFAIASAGWVAGILVLICATCVTWWTCLLIGRTMNGDPRPTHFFDDSPFNAKLAPGSSQDARLRPQITGLPHMATESFGTAGNVVLSAVLYFELFSSLCVFLVTLGDHLYTLYPAISTSTHTIIVSILLAIPTALLRTPRLLSYMSAVGTFSTVAIVLAVAASAVIEGDLSQQLQKQEQIDQHQPTHSLWISSGIAISIGLVAFCYSGHAIIPTFYQSMERPQDFEKMLSCSYTIVLLSYIMVGLSGYYMFGSTVDDQITLSLSHGSSMETAMTCLTWLMVLTAFSKATLYVFPLALGVEEIVAPRLSNEFAVRVASCTIKVTMIFFALLVSIFVPSFGFICAVVGMVCTMIVSVIFPAAAHLQLFHNGLTTKEKFLDWLIIIVGVTVAVVGTIAIV